MITNSYYLNRLRLNRLNKILKIHISFYHKKYMSTQIQTQNPTHYQKRTKKKSKKLSTNQSKKSHLKSQLKNTLKTEYLIYQYINKTQASLTKIKQQKFDNFLQMKLRIFIIGTTATGKTALSIALGKHLNAEIVSCDSMQLYKQADIMTAKATNEEQQAVKHHMLDILELDQFNYTRNQYFKDSYSCIQKLEAQQKNAIIVGGTNYYMETLLFKQKMQESDESFQQFQENNKEKNNINIQEEYKNLQEIDPEMAERIHPNDWKRIQSYLKLYNETKQIPSQIIQKKEDNQLRQQETVIFFPQATSFDYTKSLIEKRIFNDMISYESIKEVFSIFNQLLSEEDLKLLEKNQLILKGVCQSIGYKEFTKLYLKYYQENQKDLGSLQEFIINNEKELKACAQILYFNTIHYAKRQLTWIRGHLIPSCSDLQYKTYILPFESKGTFESQVINPAKKIVDSLINKEEFKEINSFLINKDVFLQYQNQYNKSNKLKTCETCQVTVNENQFQKHLDSRKHKKQIDFKENPEKYIRKMQKISD